MRQNSFIFVKKYKYIHQRRGRRQQVGSVAVVTELVRPSISRLSQQRRRDCISRIDSLEGRTAVRCCSPDTSTQAGHWYNITFVSCSGGSRSSSSHSTHVISQLLNLFIGTPRICKFILLLIVWVRSFSEMLPSMKFVEDKVLVFVILREKC